GDPAGPLVKALDWRFFQRDGKWFARETNTMPQWAGSCWYYLRYLDPKNSGRIFAEKAYDDWMPVDLYVGGSEHAVLHLLYARFWHKVLYDAGVVKHPEPFAKLVHQGMILGRSYRFYVVKDAEGRVLRAVDGDASVKKGAEAGVLLLSETGERVEAELVREAVFKDGKPYHPEFDVPLGAVNEKMSKSRGNVVGVDDVCDEFGADSLRVYEMFMGPLQQVKAWQTSGIQGVRRFLERVHALGHKDPVSEIDGETEKQMHRTVRKVQEDIEALRFNTAISALMIYVNHLAALPVLPRVALERLIQCLAPFAPHMAEELWQQLGYHASIADVPWPSYDAALCVDDVVEVPVQVNGKVRGRLLLPPDADEDRARALALDDAAIQASLAGKELKKVIYVPGRVLNLVVR
ncbi:MAG: class I tRNA ligase family protein, partial [Polyangiaceae bacterium]